jgi:hypothetical protein
MIRAADHTINRTIHRSIHDPLGRAAPSCRAPYVDLAGDGGGDQGAAAFLEKGDGALSFIFEGIEPRRFMTGEIHYRKLLLMGRNSQVDTTQGPDVYFIHRSAAAE